MNLVQFLRILWARKSIILATLLACFFAATVTVNLLPQRYEAHNRVLIDVTKPDAFLGQMSNQAMGSYIANQMKMIKDVQTAGLVKGIRSPLVDDIANLRQLTANIQRNRGELDRALQVMPIKLEKVGRTAIYGSWFNFYLCSFQGTVKLPGITVPVKYNTGSDRCDLG